MNTDHKCIVEEKMWVKILFRCQSVLTTKTGQLSHTQNRKPIIDIGTRLET